MERWTPLPIDGGDTLVQFVWVLPTRFLRNQLPILCVYEWHRQVARQSVRCKTGPDGGNDHGVTGSGSPTLSRACHEINIPEASSNLYMLPTSPEGPGGMSEQS